MYPKVWESILREMLQAAASKKGAMRALGRVVRDDEAANEVVAAGGLTPVIALLTCNDAAVVRRLAVLCPQTSLSLLTVFGVAGILHMWQNAQSVDSP